MKIKASGTQVSDAINLATAKAGLVGVNRNVRAIAYAGDKAYVSLGGGDSIEVTMTPGAYPAIQSIDKTAMASEGDEQIGTQPAPQ